MSLAVALKSTFASSLHALGWVDRRIRREGSGKTALLAYHRILPAVEARRKGVQAGMYVEPGTFAMQVRYLKERFDLVPLDALMESTPRRGYAKPRCVLTFDDGWRDFHLHAFPVLRETGVPAAVFLPTDYVGTGRRFWTDRLAYLFRGMTEGAGNPGGANPLRGSLEDRIGRLAMAGYAGMEEAIRLLKTHREEEIGDVLNALSSRRGLPMETSGGPQFLSWEEVRDLKRSGLVSFGSHTATHRILTTLTDAEVDEELRRSMKRMMDEEIADARFMPFCYPNGSFNERIARLVKDAGFHMAVTTDKGWNRSGDDPFHLRRISAHQDMTSSEAMMGCRILGIF